MRLSRSLFVVAIASVIAGCASRPGAMTQAPASPRSSRIAAAPAGDALAEGAPREELPWASFSPETFARARAEHKYIILDGSAEWCHWCHVMEATTYHDPEVRKLLDAHFIAVKVDVDARPDVEERYADYGWPATVLFSPDAVEIGKYRGYIAPEKLTEILKEVIASGLAGKPGDVRAKPAASVRAPRTALAEEHLLWIQHAVEVDLDGLYDDEQGGWGMRQKAPLGWDNAWLLHKAAQGDTDARKKIVFTLDQQSKLLDPVWGGIYQYSAAGDWDSPHFEKLMTFQAPALDNYASAYRLTGDARQLARAKAMLSFLDRFMKSPEGGFYTTQDADLNAHDRDKPFMDGHAYYALDEQRRLAAGLPRVDTHEYGRENGLAIAATCTMYEVTKDPAVLASAEKAARRVLATHGSPRGGITHDVVDPAKPPKQLFLSDNAAFGLALVRLHEVTRNDDYLKKALAIADFMIRDLTDDAGGGMFGSTKDPDAVGVFSARRVPFEDNVMAVRMLAHLARALSGAEVMSPAPAPRRGTDAALQPSKNVAIAMDRLLRAISQPEEIKARGRMIGDYLLALEESKGVRGVLR